MTCLDSHVGTGEASAGDDNPSTEKTKKRPLLRPLPQIGSVLFTSLTHATAVFFSPASFTKVNQLAPNGAGLCARMILKNSS